MVTLIADSVIKAGLSSKAPPTVPWLYEHQKPQLFFLLQIQQDAQ